MKDLFKLYLFFGLSFLAFSIFASDKTPYTVYFKPGKILVDVESKNETVTTKGMYVKVLEVDSNRRELFNVYDKTGKIKFQTDADGLVEIAEDIRILPGIDPQKIYPPKSVFKTENKTAYFDSQINIHFDDLTLSNLNGIYSDNIQNVLATRYEIRTLYISELPVQFGLALNYQSAYWKNDFEEVRISILSFGPHFQYNFYRNEGLIFNALLGAEVAPIYKGTTATYTDKYSAALFDLGVESEWDSVIGKWSLGSHFRHHEISLDHTTRPNSAITPKEFSLNSLGIMLGYKIEWEL